MNNVYIQEIQYLSQYFLFKLYKALFYMTLSKLRAEVNERWPIKQSR